MLVKKTKIVCSIGPSCNDDKTIQQMIESGMNVARFNFSHGTYEWHKEAMERVRRVSNYLNIPVAILLDTKGPEIRTGIVKDDGKIKINTGDTVRLTCDDAELEPQIEEAKGREKTLSINWREGGKKLFSGVKVLIADGLISLTVKEVKPDSILCEADNAGVIGSRKNVNLKGVHAGLPIINEKDKSDLQFGVKMGIDFVALSFVSFPEEVVTVKMFLRGLGSDAKVIAKIENEEGINNIEGIIREADGIMVARGDLGVQLPTEKIPLAQKRIIRLCREHGRPVITATQMLDSMINNPRPTRAELTDVSNAVFDGTDAVMLSGETAGGKYPVESVKMMSLITRTTEESPEYISKMEIEDDPNKVGEDAGHLVAHSAYKLAGEVSARAIITPTLHGNTARIIGSFRPPQVVIAVTPEEKVCRSLMIQWGVSPVLCKVADDSEAMIQNAIKTALDSGAVKLGDKVVMCAGIPIKSPLIINTIKVTLIGNVLARGQVFGSANKECKKVSGRVIHADNMPSIKEKLGLHKSLVLVCSRITQDLTGALRVVSAVVSEGGCDIPIEELHYINPDLVYILNARDAYKYLENDLSVTLDAKEGIIYEGIV